MKNFEEMKKDNKGFSLVELIVVIAIMAVLIAVLGSTILGYVEKSKYSKDIQALDSLKTAVSTFVANPDSKYKNNTDTTLEAIITGDANSDFYDPNETIKKTLQEVFTFPAADAANTDITFNNASAVFEGLEAGDIQVKIVNGAVSICAPMAQGTDTKDYDAYIAGEEYKANKDACKSE